MHNIFSTEKSDKAHKGPQFFNVNGCTHNKSPSNLLIVSLINAVARSFGLNTFLRITVRFNTRNNLLFV
jgi:hypothetical protein